MRWEPEILFLSRADSSGDQGRESGSQSAAERCGYADSCHFLGVSELELFQRVTAGDIDWFRSLRDEVAEWLREKSPEIVCVDAYEAYNFTHDLCPLLLESALRLLDHQPVQRFEIPLGYLDPPIPPVEDRNAPVIRIPLSREEKAFKARLIEAWTGYGGDPEKVIEAMTDELRECDLLRRVESPRDFLSPAVCNSRASYEDHGRRRVAEGKYQVALLHKDHFRPIAEALLSDFPPSAA